MNGQPNLLPGKAMKAGELKAVPLLLAITVAAAGALYGQAPSRIQGTTRAQGVYLNLPLSFERQEEGGRERYVAQGQGYAIGLEKGRASIGLAAGRTTRGGAGKLISIEFAGGKESSAIPGDELPGKVNRYFGNDPRQWKTGIATFGKVAYKDIYPGIDIVYYGNQKQLEFDFVVRPGADPGAIRMKVGGAGSLTVDGSGALMLDQNRDLRIALPAVYQEVRGVRTKIAGHYQIRGHDEVAFAVKSWDRTQPLVIDPTLIYSGMIGGGSGSSTGNGIAVDGSGNIYLAGNTYSTDFPSVSSAQSGASLAGDGFVTKINPAGTAILYSTYFGGKGYDTLQAIAVDGNAAVWVAGQTQSSDFPLMNPTQSAYGGNTDAVVAKFSSTGTLQFSTYVGGNSYDNAYAVAVDSSNAGYIAGETQSSSFPTTPGALLTAPAGQQNAFVVKFNSSATRVYATLIGGESYDGAYGIAVDSAGAAYVTGVTSSSFFSGAPGGGAKTTYSGAEDAFIAKLNPAGSALVYFTYLGGAGADSGQAIALDSSNNAYAAGSTTSTGLATAGAAQTIPGSGYDGFIAKLNSTGSALTYLTYLGGNRQDYITGLALDSSGNTYVGGSTNSNTFPMVSPLQPRFPGNPTSLFQTANSGSLWSSADTVIGGAVLDVSIDPVTAGIFVAATENGIFRTTNSAGSWTPSLPLVYVLSLTRSPAKSTTIYALSPNNVYLSSDNGVTWQFQGSLISGYFEGLVADPQTATTVYAYSQDSGVYVSTNGGATWVAANSGLPSAGVATVVAAPDGSLYASVPGYGLYKSANQAGGWAAVNAGLPSGAAFNAHSLSVSGTTVYAGSGTLYKTTNGGTNWSPAAGAVPNGAYVIGVAPSNASVVYATAVGGMVYISTDGGATWNAANAGISNLTQVSEFVFDPMNASHAVVVVLVSQAGFVAQLNPAGSAFGYSTWFGATEGNSYTSINALAAIPSSGDVFITGYASSDTGAAFPATTTAFQGSSAGAYVARISASTATCGVALAPASQTLTGVAQTIGLGAIAPSGCSWSAASDQSWATVTRGTNDAGIDVVTIQLAANLSGTSRTAIITAGSASATITQADSGCNYALSTSALNMVAAGGTASVGLTTAAGCPWSVTNTDPFGVTVTSGASGTGNGTIGLTVAANSGFSSRYFYLTVGSAQLSIAQAGSCTYTFNPTSGSFAASGGNGSFSVTASSNSCKWFASASDSWITLAGTASGTGNGTVNYTVAPDAGAMRTGTISLGGFGFAITESGAIGTATTTTLTVAPNPSTFGQSVTLTATVSPSTAIGTVTFLDGSAMLATGTLSNGSATLSLSTLTVGSHSLTAMYSGDSTFVPGTSATLTQVVNQQATNTALTSSVNPSVLGQSVTFTANVVPSGVTGSVTFKDGSATLGTVTLAAGVATFSTSGLSAASHPITAVYSGAPGFLASTSPMLSQAVGLSTSTTTITSSAGPVNPGDSVTFTATIAPSTGTGLVTFQDENTGTTLSVVTPANGVATLTTSFSTPGPHGITALYSGDSNTSASSSVTLVQHVLRLIFYDSFNAAPNPLWLNEVGNWGTSGGAYSAGSPGFSPNAHSLLPFALTDFRVRTDTTQLGDGGVWLRATDSPGTGVGVNGVLALLKPGAGQVAFTVVQNGVFGPLNPSASLPQGPHSFDIVVSGTNYSLFVDGASTPLLSMDSTAFTSGQTGLYDNVTNGYDNFSVYFPLYFGTSSTTTTLTSSANPSVSHQSVTFTATVVGPGATGTVAFQDAGSTVGTAPLNAGIASFSTTSLSTGVHPTTAVYSGDAGYSSSGSSALGQTVNQVITTTTMTSSANPSAPGQSVTLTATVSPAVATGTVRFTDGSATLGTGTLTNGVATFTTSALAPGAHSLTAVYAGDANDAVSTSPTLTQNVSLIPVTTTLTSSANPSSFGQTVTFTATVSPSASTGTITFKDGAITLGTGTLSGGVATFAVSSLTVAAHSVTAVYPGDTTHVAGTSAALTQTVARVATTTNLISSLNPSLPGQNVTFTATVLPSSATGTVTFNDGANTLGTGTLAAGVATFQTSVLGSGSHSLTAVYGGDSSYATSASAAIIQSINQTPTTTSVTANPSSITYGQTVTFTATVFPSTATGAVVFKDGSATLGTGTVSGGLATFTTATLNAGARQITALYGGDTLNPSSTSAVLSYNVNPAVTTITLSSSAPSVTAGQSVTFRAVVTPSTATGTVTFKDGGSLIGSASLSGGVASISTTLGFGSHGISATYSGDANFAPGTSAALTQGVNYPPLLITTSSLPNGAVGQPYGPVSMAASGGSGAYSWSASGLPQGLSLSSTGAISGSSSVPSSGSVSIIVTDNISNLTSSTNLTLTIAAQPLNISGPATLGNVLVGASVAATYSASGGLTPYTWSISGAPGISVDAGGRVTGTAGAAGNFSLTLTVTDAQNGSRSQALTLSVFGITTSSLPPGTSTTDYSASVTAAGGAGPYTFAFTGLPAGLSATGGSLSGRTVNPGSFSVAVRVTEGGGLSATASYTLTITGPSPLGIISSTLPDAIVGQSYNASLNANGGTTPYTWSQSGGILPDGLSVSSSGVITGVPTTPASSSLGIQVRDANGSVVSTVSITVKPAPLVITNGATFPSGVAGLSYAPQILLANGGIPPYTFGIRGSLPAGLVLSSGQIGGTPTTAGDSGFTLTVSDSAPTPATGLFGVALSIRPASPDIVLSTGSASFAIAAGTSSAPQPAVIAVASSLVSQLINFSPTPSVPWLTVSGNSTTPGFVSVALNSAALTLTAAGSPYSGSVVIACTTAACAGKSQTVVVSLTVTAPPPQLSLGTTLISFAAVSSNPQPSTASLGIVNSGGGLLKITSVTSDSAWLTVGSFPATVAPGPGAGVIVTANPSGLAAGYYRGIVSVATSNGSGTVAVTLFVSAAATMNLSPSGAQLSLPQGGVLGNSSGAFFVSATTGATVPYTASVVQGDWLQVTSGGTGLATAVSAGTVGYSISATAASALTVGVYYGTIRVNGSGVANTPLDFQVILVVTPSTTQVIPDLQPAGLVFVSAVSAAPTNQTINVYASSRTPLAYQVSASTEQGNWLTVSPSQGSASAATPGAVTVTAVSGALPAGAYRGTISFSFGSTVRAVNVTLIVQPSQAAPASRAVLNASDTAPTCANAVLVPTQTGLVSNFAAPTSWPSPLSIKLFDSCGSTVGNAQIVASFTNGDPLLPLALVTSGSGLYSATWTPRKASGQITVLASVNAPGYPAASVKIAGQVSPNTAPVLSPNAAGDVFYPQVGAGLGPGNIVQIYGSGLASATATPATLPLPTSMNGTSVVIGGVRAPLFYISPGQINAQIPFELAPGNQYQLIVNANGQLTTPQSLQLNGGTPAILNFSSGAVVAQHLDGMLVKDTAPAAPGEFVVIYASGLGATDIPVPSGSASPSDPPARVADMPVLTLNGNTIKVLFAGLTPGLVGLYQVNFQVPEDAKTGNYNLVLTQSGTPSNRTVLNIQAPKPQ
jgi:hypothetical protein